MPNKSNKYLGKYGFRGAYKCPKCGEVENSQKDLKNHMKEKHAY